MFSILKWLKGHIFKNKPLFLVMKMIKKFAAGLLGLLLTLSNPANAQDDIITTYGVQISSNYVFRGRSFSDSGGWVVQPYMSASKGKFSGTLFLNNNLKTKSINKINFEVDYNDNIKDKPFNLNYVFTLFPGAGDLWTQEAGISIAPTDNINLEFIHDFGTIKGQYVSLSINKVVDKLEGTAKIGLNNNYLREELAVDINFGLIALPEYSKLDDIGYVLFTPTANYSFGLGKNMGNIPYVGVKFERTE